MTTKNKEHNEKVAGQPRYNYLSYQQDHEWYLIFDCCTEHSDDD